MTDSLDDAMDKPFILDALNRWKQDKRNGSRIKTTNDTTPASDTDWCLTYLHELAEAIQEDYKVFADGGRAFLKHDDVLRLSQTIRGLIPGVPPTPASDETEYPSTLKIRDTKLNDDMGGLGHRIFTTAGQGYDWQTYHHDRVVRELQAERDKYKAANDEVIYRNTLLVLDNEVLKKKASAQHDALDAAEKAIRDAPHDQDCRWHDEDENGYPLREKDCTCWKREALEHFTGE